MGVISLLEWLTELRESFYLLDYWFITKKYNLGTTRWKRYMGQNMGKRGGVSMSSPDLLSKAPCIHQLGISLNATFLGLYCGFIAQHNPSHHWPLVTDSISSLSLLTRCQVKILSSVEDVQFYYFFLFIFFLFFKFYFIFKLYI